MAKDAEVATALLAHCELMSGEGPALPVAMPEVSFTPPSDGRYLRIDLFRNAPFWASLSHGHIAQGLLQVTVVWPKGQGIIAPGRASDAVKDHFPKGLILYAGEPKVKVSGDPWAAAPLSDDTDSETPVTIPWRA